MEKMYKNHKVQATKKEWIDGEIEWVVYIDEREVSNCNGDTCKEAIANAEEWVDELNQ